MTEPSAAARTGAAANTTRQRRTFDDKCVEWDALIGLGESPMDAAYRSPGQWQLVYELRPLELVPYWLGIPFRPCHPVYAVIYDHANAGYYTAPAVKVAELGRPTLVRGPLPFARLLDALAGLDRRFYACSERLRMWGVAGFRFAEHVAVAVAAAVTTRAGARP